MNNKKENSQATLWGDFVEKTEENPLEFVKVYEEVVNDGDQFTLALNAATYNDEKDCLTVIDADKNMALTVYFTQHPNAKYQSTPEGVRLVRAIQRCIEMTIGSTEEVVNQIKDNDFVLTVTHTGSKGRLWTVAQSA